jgi:hypothetical protein
VFGSVRADRKRYAKRIIIVKENLFMKKHLKKFLKVSGIVLTIAVIIKAICAIVRKSGKESDDDDDMLDFDFDDDDFYDDDELKSEADSESEIKAKSEVKSESEE